MSQSKTDKIRERLEDLPYRDRREHQIKQDVRVSQKNWNDLIDSLEAVVEECSDTQDNVNVPLMIKGLADELLEIIADELDVEDG